jgi:hypothetical protein
MEYEAFEGLIKFIFIIGMLCWFTYITRDLLFDYMIESKMKMNHVSSYLFSYLWKCVQMVVVIGVGYAITMDLMRTYLSPGQ